MRNILLPLAALATVSAAVAAPAQPQAQAQQPERVTAAAAAERMRPHLPREFSAGLVARAVRAEGDLLILTVEVPPDWPAHGVAVFTQGFTDGICSHANDPFFDNGISIRIDTIAGGRGETATGQVISSCPSRR